MTHDRVAGSIVVEAGHPIRVVVVVQSQVLLILEQRHLLKTKLVHMQPPGQELVFFWVGLLSSFRYIPMPAVPPQLLVLV